MTENYWYSAFIFAAFILGEYAAWRLVTAALNSRRVNRWLRGE